MIDSPLDILLVMFQEDRYFWAVLDDERHKVDCRFCGGVGDRPENVQHLTGCVIELAVKMLMSDQAYLERVNGRPPRRVYRGTATLTVWRRGAWKDTKWLRPK